MKPERGPHKKATQKEIEVNLLTEKKEAMRLPEHHRAYARLLEGVVRDCGGADASAAYQEGVAYFGQGKAESSFCGAARALTLACVLSPDPEQAKAAIEEFPVIPWILRGELEARSGGGKALVRVS